MLFTNLLSGKVKNAYTKYLEKRTGRLKQKVQWQNMELALVLAAVLVLNGGFFDYSVAFCGALICLLLFVRMIKKREFYKRDKRKVFLIPIFLVAIGMIVSLWSVDKVENLFGVLRLIVICLWMRLVHNSTHAETNIAKKSIPVVGIMMMLVSAVAYFIPDIKPAFWENERLAGFFQYANTCALFLAVGMIVLLTEQSGKKVRTYIQIGILLAGVLLTGSRSILLLGILWGCYYAIINKKFRKPFFVTGGLLAVLGFLLFLCTGSTDNITRIFSVFQSNSTMWGRILYDRDALLYLVKKFYGLGRMGYYYSQGLFQSGVYHVRFVHNDFLQIALDYGIVAFVFVMIFLIWQFIYGKQERKEKEILLFMCVAATVDFHFQYLAVWMIAMLFMDYGTSERENKKELREDYVILPVCVCLFLYIGAAAGFAKAGKTEIALSMLPDYSYAQEKAMKSQMETETSYYLAQSLIQKNPYHISAHVVSGMVHASYLQVEETIEDFDYVIKLDPYNVTYYQQYDALLENMEQQLAVSGDVQESSDAIELIEMRREKLTGELEDMKKRTSRLAYKIKDVPQFTY